MNQSTGGGTYSSNSEDAFFQSKQGYELGRDVLLFTKSSIVSYAQYYMGKGAPAGVGVLANGLGLASTALSFHAYMKEPTAVNLGKFLLSTGSMAVPTSRLLYVGISARVSGTDIFGGLDGIYNYTLTPSNNWLISQPWFQETRSNYLNSFK